MVGDKLKYNRYFIYLLITANYIYIQLLIECSIAHFEYPAEDLELILEHRIAGTEQY